MTLVLLPERFEELKYFLEKNGYAFEERPHQVFLAKKPGVAVNLYKNGKIVIGGSDLAEGEQVRAFLGTMDVKEVVKTKKEYAPIEVSGMRIGTDEVGKGDYFGPLVIGGVAADESQVQRLETLGIKDSKALSDTTIQNLAVGIRRELPESQREVVVISPLKYNLLQQKSLNVNGILGWGHARTIENLVSSNPSCRTAVADQFGDQSHIENALMKQGKEIKLIQTPKAEREVTVAAASILARSEFVNRMRELTETFGVEFPKGATDVIPTASQFVRTYGSRALLNVAKVHFKTTRNIPEVVSDDLVIKPNSLPAQEKLPTLEVKISRDIRLECFNLIDSFESDFRRYIANKLEAHFGSDWWETTVDKHVRGKAESLCRKERDRGVDVDLIDCLEMDHYRIIITDKVNWKKVFEPVFKDKDAFLARHKILKDIRNPVAHSRGLLKHGDRQGVVSAILWIKDKLG